MMTDKNTRPTPSSDVVARTIYETYGFDYDCRTINANGEAYGEWAKALRAAFALSRLSPPAQVVKPLEWEPGVVDWARPFPGMKYVACSTTPAGAWAWWLEEAPETRDVFPSEVEAKAAAQADYERRILSALAPAQVEVTDEMVERAMAAKPYKKSELTVWDLCDQGMVSETAIHAALTAALTAPDAKPVVPAEPVAWLTIESAPKNGDLIILRELHDDGWDCLWIGRWHLPDIDEGYWTDSFGDRDPGYPTHWMPLPFKALDQSMALPSALASEGKTDD